VATWPAAGGKTHGCMWNGPAWPHATCIILDILATALREYDQRYVTPEHFWHMLDRYTHLQYENDDLNRPLVTEYYDGQSGSPDPTGCPDYFHSTYCDRSCGTWSDCSPPSRPRWSSIRFPAA